MNGNDQTDYSLTNEATLDSTVTAVDQILSKAKHKLISFPECWSKGCRPEHRICDCSLSNCRNLCRNYKQCKVHDSERRSMLPVELYRLPGNSAGIVETTRTGLRDKSSKLSESEIQKSS